MAVQLCTPTKCNLVYQAITKKLVKVDKLQTTFKGAEGTEIYSVRRKAIPDIYNYLYIIYIKVFHCLVSTPF